MIFFISFLFFLSCGEKKQQKISILGEWEYSDHGYKMKYAFYENGDYLLENQSLKTILHDSKTLLQDSIVSKYLVDLTKNPWHFDLLVYKNKELKAIRKGIFGFIDQDKIRICMASVKDKERPNFFDKNSTIVCTKLQDFAK